jgi:glutathione S-transferase
MSNAIKIHSFPLSGHAHRAVLFASLAGIDHTVNDVDLPGGEHKQPAFLALNPAGQVPVIEDGDVVISDANAILV